MTEDLHQLEIKLDALAGELKEIRRLLEGDLVNVGVKIRIDRLEQAEKRRGKVLMAGAIAVFGLMLKEIWQTVVIHG